MGEAKSPALPLGDGASVENSIAYFSGFHKSRRGFRKNFLFYSARFPSLPGDGGYGILAV